MSFKLKIRTVFKKLTGYFIYKKSDLPFGIDLQVDLETKLHCNVLCIFDVGANVGQSAIYYSKLFPHAKLYSFEPIAAIYSKLKENLKNSNTQSFNIAFSDTSGSQEIFLHEDPLSELNSLRNTNVSVGLTRRETIQLELLDDFAKEHEIKTIDILKIDTEGHELNVLKGAVKLLQDKRINYLLCEVSLSNKNTVNSKLEVLIEFLETYNYYFVGLNDVNTNYYKLGLTYGNAVFIPN